MTKCSTGIEMGDSPWPLTVPNAVDSLLQSMSDEHLAMIRTTAYDDLIDHHFGVGLVIRNRCHLHDNPTLVEATGVSMVDNASLRLLQALWRRLRH